MTCEICYDDFSNKIKKFNLKCCAFQVCIDCMKQHILLDDSINPACVKCKSSLSYVDFEKSFPTSWKTKKYRPHLDDLLMDLEIVSKVNETIIYLEGLKRKADLKVLIDNKQKELYDFPLKNIDILDNKKKNRKTVKYGGKKIRTRKYKSKK